MRIGASSSKRGAAFLGRTLAPESASVLPGRTNAGPSLAPSAPTHPTSPSESPIRVTADAGSAPEAIDGERKTVTALSRYQGLDELMEDLDPEEAPQSSTPRSS